MQIVYNGAFGNFSLEISSQLVQFFPSKIRGLEHREHPKNEEEISDHQSRQTSDIY